MQVLAETHPERGKSRRFRGEPRPELDVYSFFIQPSTELLACFTMFSDKSNLHRKKPEFIARAYMFGQHET